MTPMRIPRDASFDAAVHLLRQPDDTYQPSIDVGAQTLPDKDFTQRIQWMVERIAEGSRVLDLGCGFGGMLHFLSRYRKVEHLGLDRVPEQVNACRSIGVKAIAADVNDLSDPALRFACSQRWDVVLIIDSLVYWSSPAVVLAALQDRCRVLYVTVPNAAKIRRRFDLLFGNIQELPNVVGSLDKGGMSFLKSYIANSWTIGSFQLWSASLGYSARPVARRSVRAKYLPLGPLPGLFCRSVLFELRPQ